MTSQCPISSVTPQVFYGQPLTSTKTSRPNIHKYFPNTWIAYSSRDQMMSRAADWIPRSQLTSSHRHLSQQSILITWLAGPNALQRKPTLTATLSLISCSFWDEAFGSGPNLDFSPAFRPFQLSVLDGITAATSPNLHALTHDDRNPTAVLTLAAAAAALHNTPQWWPSPAKNPARHVSHSHSNPFSRFP